jgi:methanogenic corrinoid protein MtbC1
LLKDSLLFLQQALEEELPANCRSNLGPYFDEALKTLDQTGPVRAELDLGDPIARLAAEYLVLALEGNSRPAIRMLVQACDNGRSLADIYRALHIAQGEVGSMWHRAEINIAEEHLVSSTTVRAMAVLAYQTDKAAPNGKTVLSVAVAGNSHDIGVRALADFFEIAGWRAICLGSDAPPADIAQAVDCFDASLLLLSAAISNQLNSVRTTVQAVRQLRSDCKIMVGGSAFIDTPEIWQRLGADGFAATPTEALALGAELVNRSGQ